MVTGDFPDLHNDSALHERLPASAEVYDGELGPGDILWAPMGTVHGAVTLEDSIVIGRNYIDCSPLAAAHSLDLWQPTCRLGGLRRLLPLGPGCDEVLQLLKEQRAQAPRISRGGDH